MEAAERPLDDVLYVGALEIRPIDGLVLAGGRALNLSVRAVGLLDGPARPGRRGVRSACGWPWRAAAEGPVGARTSRRGSGEGGSGAATAPSTSTSTSCA